LQRPRCELGAEMACIQVEHIRNTEDLRYYTVIDNKNTLVIRTTSWSMARRGFGFCQRGRTARTLYILSSHTDMG